MDEKTGHTQQSANSLPSDRDSSFSTIETNPEIESLRPKIKEAIKNRKIYVIRGNIPYLEESLKKRGWIGKYESAKTHFLPYGTTSSSESLSFLDATNSADVKLAHRQEFKCVQPNFIWDCRNDFITWNRDIKPDTILNRLEKSVMYTSKLGMAKILREPHWFFEKDVSEVYFPRSYNPSRDESAFIEDYRKTSAISMLSYFIEQIEKGVNLENKPNSKSVTMKEIKFALKRCEEILSMSDIDDLDFMQREQVSEKEWEEFVENYVKFVHEDCALTDFEKNELSVVYNESKNLLKKIKEIDPEFDFNDMRNIWILKPNTTCCGNGIIMTHKLDKILKKISKSPKNYFILQKYIEKPLLIKNTKFDVRFYYLITCSYPLTIWTYKESLIRFSSRPFTLNTYHEVYHLCNTAIQNRYADQAIPVRSLNWDCDSVNHYLKNELNFDGNPWYEKIHSKMSQAVIATMLAVQEKMDQRVNSFELYGADFIIMEDLSVMLIEINSNPRTHPPSSKITERLYPELLESLIKVVLDYPKNPETDTGKFVLTYKQNISIFDSFMEKNLIVKGTKICKN